MKGNPKRINKLGNTLPNYHEGNSFQCKCKSYSLHMKAHGPKLYKKQRHSGEIQASDFKYMYQKPDGDVGFDPEHNRRVIEQTIKKTKKREAELRKQYMEQVEERVDAGTYFLKKLASGAYTSLDPNSAALKYFGKRELARLRGEEIKEQIMQTMYKIVN